MRFSPGTALSASCSIPLAAAFAVLGVCPAESNAVILYRTATRNTTAPSGPLANSGWQWQGQFGSFLGTPIAPQYFITAQHIGGSPNNTIVLNGTTYNIDTSWFQSGPGWLNDPTSDLRIWKIQQSFPTYAQMYDPAVDGSEVGRIAMLFGRGTARGAEVYSRFPSPPRDQNGDAANQLHELKGWAWGAFDSVQSWGMNIITGMFDAGPGIGPVAYCDFDSDGLFDEGSLSAGDSGGGMFILTAGGWKLAGIHIAADGPWRTSVDRPAFDAAIFDAGGLYVNNPPQWIPDAAIDVPGASYTTSTSAHLAWIQGVVGSPPITVPEPSGLVVLLGSAGVSLLSRRCRRTDPGAIP